MNESPKTSKLSGRRRVSIPTLKMPQPLASPVNESSEEKELPSNSSQKYSLDYTSDLLGIGSTARVRLGHRLCDGQKVAVKVTMEPDEELVRVAQKEYELISSLRHPNIIAVEDLYCSSSTLMIFMELCSGGSLEAYVSSRGVVLESDALGLFEQLLTGIHHLHQKRIVHRDIKPDNVLMQPARDQGKFIIKIADFNSATKIGAFERQNSMLSERGTCFYSAPELRFGHIWNERIDIWAAGMCFYFLRQARSPFNIMDPGQAQILRGGRLPEISWGGFSDLARSLLLQCLAVEMRDRPAAMELLLHPVFAKNRKGYMRSRSCVPVKATETGESDAINVDHLQKAGERRKLLDALPVAPSTHAAWKEARNHSDSLQRLAHKRCERNLLDQLESTKAACVPPQSEEDKRWACMLDHTPREDTEDMSGRYSGSVGSTDVPGSASCSPSQGSSQVRRKRRTPPDVQKFFTTHGAMDNEKC